MWGFRTVPSYAIHAPVILTRNMFLIFTDNERFVVMIYAFRNSLGTSFCRAAGERGPEQSGKRVREKPKRFLPVPVTALQLRAGKTGGSLWSRCYDPICGFVELVCKQRGQE